MALFDLDFGGKRVISKSAEEYELLILARKRLDPRTFKKMICTIDTALEKLPSSKSSQLTWTKCASLIGYNSRVPTQDSNHLWQKASETFLGHTKVTNMFVGGLVRWRISLLPETWLCMREEKDAIDPDTGKIITIATYWINENFQPHGRNRKSSYTVNDLSNKFKQL